MDHIHLRQRVTNTIFFVLIKHGSWETLFGLLNHTNTEVIKELIKIVLHNFVENTASCPNYSCFGEYLDRKGLCSSEPDIFCMAARSHSVYSFTAFMCFCISGSFPARIFKSDSTAWKLQFLRSSEASPQCLDVLVTRCRYRREGGADPETGSEFSLFSPLSCRCAKQELCKAAPRFCVLLLVCFHLGEALVSLGIHIYVFW